METSNPGKNIPDELNAPLGGRKGHRPIEERNGKREELKQGGGGAIIKKETKG